VTRACGAPGTRAAGRAAVTRTAALCPRMTTPDYQVIPRMKEYYGSGVVVGWGMEIAEGFLGDCANAHRRYSAKPEPVPVSALTGEYQLSQGGDMTKWQPIETIPPEYLDGREVWVKRMSPSNPGQIVSEGWAVYGVCAPSAPQRQPLGPDPLGRLTSADYAREDRDRLAHADQQKWLKPDRMYSFPTPTHWRAFIPLTHVERLRDETITSTTSGL
jgi:hypothetical protein